MAHAAAARKAAHNAVWITMFKTASVRFLNLYICPRSGHEYREDKLVMTAPQQMLGRRYNLIHSAIFLGYGGGGV
jgi:hypothetical protein